LISSRKLGENPDTGKLWRIGDLLTRWTQISPHHRAYQLDASDSYYRSKKANPGRRESLGQRNVIGEICAQATRLYRQEQAKPNG
jgi:hypothetical protein